MVVVPGFGPREEEIAPVSYDESYDYEHYGGDGDMYAGAGQMMDTGDQDKGEKIFLSLIRRSA